MKTKIISIGFCIFLLSFIIQSIDLNAEGRTWDEQFKTDTGILALHNIASGKFLYSDWAVGFEHPPFAKYIYGLTFLPELRTIDPKNVSQDEYKYLMEGNYYAGIRNGLIKVQPYDFTLPRMLSVFLNAATISLVFIIGYLIFRNIGTSIIAAGALLFTPRFVAMGRLMTYESISGFIVSLLFLIFIVNKKRYAKFSFILTIGLLLGALLWTRYNNISVFITYVGWSLICLMFQEKRDWGAPIFHIILSFFIAGIIGFIVWPFLWIDFPRGIIATVLEHRTRAIFFSYYHVRSLLETTPIIFLIAGAIGMGIALLHRTEERLSLVWWFISTCIFFVFFSSPGGGTRYMYVVYPSGALLVALGFDWIIKKIQNTRKTLFYLLFVIYGITTLTSIHPYYLDYYNEFVGGVKGAAEKKREVGWWGEGQREAGMWLKNNAFRQAKIGFIVTPKYVFPRVRSDVILLPYGEQIGKADYVVITANDLKLFNKIEGKWENVHVVRVQGVPLIYIKKRTQ